MVRPPISPETIHVAENGRFMYFEVDVTDFPFWWLCPDCGLSYQESLAVITAASDDALHPCPACKVAAGLCSASGCWEPAPFACDCESGAHTHACQTHADPSESDHSGRSVRISRGANSVC